MDTSAPTYRCPQFRDLVDRYRRDLQAGVADLINGADRQVVQFQRVDPPAPG